MFFTIFEDLCAKKGKTPTAVGNELGIAKTTISYWRNKSGVIPKQDVILKLSEYFGVSTDYLLSGEEQETKNSPEEPKLTEGEEMLLSLFRQIPEERQPEALELLRVALKMQKKP